MAASTFSNLAADLFAESRFSRICYPGLCGTLPQFSSSAEVGSLEAKRMAVSHGTPPPPDWEQEKYREEFRLRELELAHRKAVQEQELQLRKDELDLKQTEARRSRWFNPLVIAVFTATAAAFGNAGVAWLNGCQQRALEKDRADLSRAAEEAKSRATLALERDKFQAQQAIERQRLQQQLLLNATQTR